MVGISRLWGIFVQSLYAANNFYPAARRSLLAIVLSSRFSFELLLSRIQEIGGYFYLYSLNVWRYLLLPFGFSFYYDWRAKNKHNLTLAVMVGLLLSMLFGGIFIFSLYYETWNLITDSLQRVSMVFPPLLIYFIFSSQIWKQHGTQRR